MLIKALVSFSGNERSNRSLSQGIFSLSKGETADIDEKSAVSFISAGYAEAVKPPRASRDVKDKQHLADNRDS